MSTTPRHQKPSNRKGKVRLCCPIHSALCKVLQKWKFKSRIYLRNEVCEETKSVSAACAIITRYASKARPQLKRRKHIRSGACTGWAIVVWKVFHWTVPVYFDKWSSIDPGLISCQFGSRCAKISQRWKCRTPNSQLPQRILQALTQELFTYPRCAWIKSCSCFKLKEFEGSERPRGHYRLFSFGISIESSESNSESAPHIHFSRSVIQIQRYLGWRSLADCVFITNESHTSRNSQKSSFGFSNEAVRNFRAKLRRLLRQGLWKWCRTGFQTQNILGTKLLAD